MTIAIIMSHNVILSMFTHNLTTFDEHYSSKGDEGRSHDFIVCALFCHFPKTVLHHMSIIHIRQILSYSRAQCFVPKLDPPMSAADTSQSRCKSG